MNMLNYFNSILWLLRQAATTETLKLNPFGFGTRPCTHLVSHFTFLHRPQLPCFCTDMAVQVDLCYQHLIHIHLSCCTVFPLKALHLIQSSCQLPTFRLILRTSSCSHSLCYSYPAMICKASNTIICTL